ncbi:BBE domain-containing protein [Marinactinospora rubrisoli]|uniref:BBE domain-containing protein n=1 Tax=Marinactinospora rubrisoli TaxID=2715399 RepID=A0ABW2KFU9_9ACTN
MGDPRPCQRLLDQLLRRAESAPRAVGRAPNALFGRGLTEEEARTLYGAGGYARLADIKARHDPDRLFRGSRSRAGASAK